VTIVSGANTRFGHEHISASAGSGKTWQLTTRYLQLVLSGCAPQTILASTFTRLAAGEIRDRIFNRLAEVVDDERARDQLRDSLGLSALTRRDVLEHLASLARQMHRMQIRTLDSYFASIVRNFSLELNVPPGADIVDEAGERGLRNSAIRELLDEREPQKIINILRQLAGGGAKRAVTDEIDRNIGDLYHLYREADGGAWDCVPPRQGMLDHETLLDAIAQLEATPVPEDQRFAKARTTDCQRARNGQWDTFLEKGLSNKIAAGNTSYYNKPIDEDLLAAYQPLIDHAAATLVNQWRERTLATYRLLTLFHDHFAQLKDERLALTFSDLVAILNESPAFAEFSDICYRLDGQIDHLLLDEFQDTSVAQWRALGVIARELAQGSEGRRSIFAVGDVKQSIYGWRGAEPDILNNLPDLLFGHRASGAMQSRTLAKSYRCSPEIIDAVNTVFQSIDSNKALEPCPDAAEHWRESFQTHETVRTDVPGYVELRVVDRAEGEKQSHLRLRHAARQITKLHERNPNLTIGVLTRTNKPAGRLMYELGPNGSNISVGSRGGGPLVDAAPVNVILDLLTLADHPDHTIAAFNVANSPLGETLELDPAGFHKVESGSRRRSVARLVRRMLADRGYARAIAQWIEQMAPGCDAREQRRLQQLLEMAIAYESQATLRADDFVEHVESTDVVDARPASVQVMTIHKSKGLDFDIVVLPELDFDLSSRQTPSVVYTRPGVDRPPDRICRYVNEDLRRFAPRLEPLFDAHTRREVRESLCMLYVAMTRAKRGLYMLIDPPGLNKGGKPSTTIPKTPAGALRCAFGEPVPEPNTLAYQHGDESWMHAPPAESDVVDQQEPGSTIDRIDFAPSSSHVRRGATTAASAHDESVTEIAAHLGVDDADSRDRGTAIHALLEHIVWLEDGVRQRAGLQRVVREVAPRRDASWVDRIVDEFLNMIEQPTVRAQLSRISKPAGCVVERELQFARFEADATARGAIDRLVIEFDDDGVPNAATVIDFKTDAINADQIPQRSERYRGQLNAYRTAAAELLGIEASAVQTILLFVAADVAVEIT